MGMALSLVIFSASIPALSYEFIGWEHGATGYKFAFGEAEKEDSPMILFFHKDSDEWSERMKEEYLADPGVEKFLNEIPRAEVNIGAGDFEKDLAAEYGVEEEPALFVVLPFSNNKPLGVSPFLKDRDMTPDEFITNIRNIFILGYNEKAHEYFEKQDYDESLEYLKKAEILDPSRSYAFYAAGIVYHTIAIKRRDSGALKKAEKNYLKALEIDPDHKESREGLKDLREDAKKLGIK